jgi:hypothetical protein
MPQPHALLLKQEVLPNLQQQPPEHVHASSPQHVTPRHEANVNQVVHSSLQLNTVIMKVTQHLDVAAAECM